MHGDRVVARIMKYLKATAGLKEKSLHSSRPMTKLLGVFDMLALWVLSFADHRKIKGDIIVPMDKMMDAKPRQKVIAEITTSNLNVMQRAKSLKFWVIINKLVLISCQSSTQYPCRVLPRSLPKQKQCRKR